MGVGWGEAVDTGTWGRRRGMVVTLWQRGPPGQHGSKGGL